MRRVLRILAWMGAGLSLLLCIASAIMWARSYYIIYGRGRSWYVADKQELNHCCIASLSGYVEFTLDRQRFNDGVVVKVSEDGHDGNLFIAGFGVLKYDPRWHIDFPFMILPPTRHWWEETGVYVRSASNVPISAPPAAWSNVMVVIPYWALFLLFLIGPWIFGERWLRRRKRMRMGLCVKCGYDLRASPERCPECGAAASAEVRI